MGTERSGFDNVEKQLKELDKQEKMERDQSSVDRTGVGDRDGRSLVDRNRDAIDRAERGGNVGK